MSLEPLFYTTTKQKMGKPLSRPDCLRQNPGCVGVTDEEDINIDDCYVPQRSIYDTVRLNEQIDSDSKGSLASRHLTERYRPYNQRTLDLAPSGNGTLLVPSALELRARESSRLDEKMIFDALKLTSNVVRSSGGPKLKAIPERKEHRRSWRTFVPPFADYPSRTEALLSESAEAASLSSWSQGKGTTGSLTSEEDSGLSSPSDNKDAKYRWINGKKVRYRSLSSVDGIPTMKGSDATGPGSISNTGDGQMSPQNPISVHSTAKSDDYVVSSTEEIELIMVIDGDAGGEGTFKHSMERNLGRPIIEEMATGGSNFTSAPEEIICKLYEVQQDEMVAKEGKEDVSTEETSYWDTVIESQSEHDSGQAGLEPDGPLSNPVESPIAVESPNPESKGYYESTPVMDEVCDCRTAAVIGRTDSTSSWLCTDKVNEARVKNGLGLHTRAWERASDSTQHFVKSHRRCQVTSFLATF